ncbi:hypothetical protein VTI28DRAFT_2776 [Corynascus sepedonium]
MSPWQSLTHTENQNQGDFYPFVLLEISVLHEPPLGHLRYGLTDMPPQPNSPPDNKTRNHFGKAKLQSIKILKTKRRSKRRKPLNRRGERNGRATLRGVVSFAKMV